jgi:acetyltransferase-like isoleucine patch superfamily enzyme
MEYYKHPTAIVEEGAEIGAGTKIWANSHVMKNAKLGKNCVIGENVHIGTGVVLGDGCKVQNSVNLYTGVTAEDYVFFGPACQTTNELNIGLLDKDGKPHTSWELGHTLFKRGCAIGANATIICGKKDNPTIIGEMAVVGSGAVVTKSVAPNTTVVGNPARTLTRRNK